MSDASVSATEAAPNTQGTPPNESTALTVRAKERLQIQKRRDLVFQMRVLERLPLSEIKKRLAAIDPSLDVDISVISRDVYQVQKDMRREYQKGRFDPGLVIAVALAEIDDVSKKAKADALTVKDQAKRAPLYRIVLDCVRQRVDILQESGLLTKELGRLLLGSGDGKKVDVVPGGAELQKLFESVNVVDGELVSEAERAWLQGDQAASEEAAREAGA